MTTKSDWHAAPHDVTAEKRRKPGDPPTTDEILAYGNGELSGADADRVRLWLAANPEMERALTTPFPEDDAKPGDPDYLSDDELSARWNALQQDLRPRGGRILQFPVHTAIAAAIALVFAGLYWQERDTTRTLSQPYAIGAPDFVEAYSAPRGGSEDGVRDIEVGPHGAYLQLAVTDTLAQWCEVTLYRLDSKNALWTGTVRQTEKEHLAIFIPRPLLEPGTTYRIEVAALPRTDVPPDEFRVRVPAR